MWFVLDPLKYDVVAALRDGAPIAEAAGAALQNVPVGSWILIAAAVLSAAACVVMEWRSGAISAAIGGRSGLAVALSLGAIFLWFGHAYFYPGHLLGGDTGAHTARIAHFADALRDGQLRHWDNAFYGGATFLQFTGPAFFWLAGGSAWLVGDPVIATKLVLFLLHVAGGWAIYLLLRRFELSPASAGIGATVYVGAFAHLHLILYKGALPQALTLALLPVAFLSVEKLSAAPRHLGPAWAMTALAVAGLVVTHQPHGLVAGLYLALFVLAALACGRYRWAVLPRCVTAAVAAACLSSFAVVPWLVESSEVMVTGSGLPVFWEWPPADYFRKLLRWSNTWTSPGAPSVAYIGLTSAILGLTAALLAAAGYAERQARQLILILVALLLISFGLRGDFVRDIVFTLFFAALLAGFGAACLAHWRGGTRRLALLIMLLLVLDLGATAVQPLARRDKDYLDEAGRYLAGQLPPRRVVVAGGSAAPGSVDSIGVSIGPSAGVMNLHPVQELSGPHNMAATRFHNYAAAVLKRVETDLRRDGGLQPATRELLAMLNVARVVNDNGRGMGLPPGSADSVVEGPLGDIVGIDRATPAVFAPRVIRIDPPAAADKPALWETSFAPEASGQAREVEKVIDAVLAAMRFDPPTSTALAIPVRGEAQAGGGSATEPTGEIDGRFEVLDYAVEAQQVYARLSLPIAGFVQLAHPWYPFQSVQVDGVEVAPLRGTLNLLVVPLTAGEHEVTIAAERSPLRRNLGIACGGFLILVIAVALWPWRSRAA